MARTQNDLAALLIERQLSAFNQNDRPLRYLGKRSRLADKLAGGMFPGKLVPRAVARWSTARHPIGTSMKFVDAPEEKRHCDALPSGRRYGRLRNTTRTNRPIAANAGIRVFAWTPRPDLESAAEQLQLKSG